MLYEGGISLGKIFGIEIKIDPSWFLIFLIVVWSLGIGVFPVIHPEWSALLVWGVSIAAALLFFVSVLLHELAHSVVARSRGLPVNQIILFIFGGVSNLQKEPTSPGTEFLMAIVGPLTSIVLGALFLLIAGISAGDIVSSITGPSVPLSQLDPVTTLLFWLGPINILVGLFNLIPGFPLDGGRVLRSVIWAITGNLRQSTFYASVIGQIVAWLFIAAGIAMIFGVVIPVLGTGLLGGIWLIFIGWFLNSAASQSYQQMVVRDYLQHVPVANLMRKEVPTVSENISVEQLVYDCILKSDKRAFLTKDDGQLEGIVTLDDVRKVDQPEWKKTKVKDIMTPMKNVDTVSPQKDTAEALDKLLQKDINQVPVMSDGSLVGLLSRKDILLWVQLQMQESDNE